MSKVTFFPIGLVLLGVFALVFYLTSYELTAIDLSSGRLRHTQHAFGLPLTRRVEETWMSRSIAEQRLDYGRPDWWDAGDSERPLGPRINFRYGQALMGLYIVGHAVNDGRLPDRYRPVFAKEMLERWRRDDGAQGTIGALEALDLIEYEAGKYEPEELDAEVLRRLREFED